MILFPTGLTSIDYEHLIKVISRFEKSPTYQLDINHLKLDNLESFIFFIDTMGDKSKQSLYDIVRFSDVTLQMISLTLFYNMEYEKAHKIKFQTELKFNWFQERDWGFITGTLLDWRRVLTRHLRKEHDLDMFEFCNKVLSIFDVLKLDKIFASYTRIQIPENGVYFK